MVVKKEILFEPAGKNRTLHIYLPDDYEQSEERYPVMYFFDGHNLYFDEDATYGKSWGLNEFLAGWPKKMIIVGVECSHEGNARLAEYCPYDAEGGFLGHIKGTGDATLDWFVHTLKPMIDQDYRTYSFREATGICGSSMGGLMSVYAGIKYNQYFSKAACLSSAISFCMDDLLKDMEETALDEDTRIYLSWGENEGGEMKKGGNPEFDSRAAKCNWKIANEFDKKHVLTRVIFQPKGNHCEASWEELVPGFMNFLWMNQ